MLFRSWALYTEHLGIEMGLYDTPEKNMGRLSYERWRACRLGVDTGLHSKGWSKAQAIAFMRDNSALTDANIEAEVNRYISWPGQALGYKIGELKIRDLRARAEKSLGSKFDLRGFHDAVLAQGAVPLDVLERQVDAWITGKKPLSPCGRGRLALPRERGEGNKWWLSLTPLSPLSVAESPSPSGGEGCATSPAPPRQLP